LCGTATIDACTGNQGPAGTPACISQIRAGFPNLPGFDYTDILAGFNDPSTAGGFATGIGECEVGKCAQSCVPYCTQ
jgi:hypothetical protein